MWCRLFILIVIRIICSRVGCLWLGFFFIVVWCCLILKSICFIDGLCRRCLFGLGLLVILSRWIGLFCGWLLMIGLLMMYVFLFIWLWRCLCLILFWWFLWVMNLVLIMNWLLRWIRCLWLLFVLVMWWFVLVCYCLFGGEDCEYVSCWKIILLFELKSVVKCWVMICWWCCVRLKMMMVIGFLMLILLIIWFFWWWLFMIFWC